MTVSFTKKEIKIQDGSYVLSVISNILSLSVVLLVTILAPLGVAAQQGNSFPIATTVEVPGASVEAGEVIIYDESRDTYTLGRVADDATVYGVSALRPAVVFSTASGTVPVITAGVAPVRIDAQGGNVARGDLLVSSSRVGFARVALAADTNVFAIALESATSGSLFVLAEVNKERAQALLTQEKERVKAQNNETGTTSTATADTKSMLTSFVVRAAIATVLALGGLLFILLSFKSVIAKGIVSIGRNPRARNSIIALSFGNIVFAIFLCAVVVFIALAILVLPV
jgi:hypothetical protein